jgi:hypothetical protein
LLLVAATLASGTLCAQSAAPGGGSPAAGNDALQPLAWLAGCWQGSVNRREFREQWMPLRGGLMVGVSHTVIGDRTQNFEYLRLEARPDGVRYVVAPSGTGETAFRLASETRDGDDLIFTFSNPVDVFPQTLIYRRGAKGWLYAHVEGKANATEQRVIYPMRRIDCETGDVLEK